MADAEFGEGGVGAVDRPRRLKRRIWSNVGIEWVAAVEPPRGCTFPEASFQRSLRLRLITPGSAK